MTGTERKTFQKYYPPDFDPSKIPRAKGGKNRQFVQRVMAPYNMQCNTCHEYIYKGKKFNMRRETVEGDSYLGLRLFRFYFRCPNCLAEITFKTDLENCDYSQEHGATRLFEAAKLYQAQVKEEEKKELEDATNPMKMLEKRTKMSRTEMESLAKLEELRETNRRHAQFDEEGMIGAWNPTDQARAIRQQEDRDDLYVKSLFGAPDEDGKRIKRLKDSSDEEDSNEARPSTSNYNAMIKKPRKAPPELSATKPSSQKALLAGLVKMKTKPKPESGPQPAKAICNKVVETKPAPGKTPGSGLSLVGDYGSGGSSEDD